MSKPPTWITSALFAANAVAIGAALALGSPGSETLLMLSLILLSLIFLLNRGTQVLALVPLVAITWSACVPAPRAWIRLSATRQGKDRIWLTYTAQASPAATSSAWKQQAETLCQGPATIEGSPQIAPVPGTLDLEKPALPIEVSGTVRCAPGEGVSQ